MTKDTAIEFGTKKTIIEHFFEGTPKETVRYEKRVRINDFKEELSEYIKFRKFTHDKHDVEFKVTKVKTRTKHDTCYVIWCWSE